MQSIGGAWTTALVKCTFCRFGVVNECDDYRLWKYEIDAAAAVGSFDELGRLTMNAHISHSHFTMPKFSQKPLKMTMTRSVRLAVQTMRGSDSTTSDIDKGFFRKTFNPLMSVHKHNTELLTTNTVFLNERFLYRCLLFLYRIITKLFRNSSKGTSICNDSDNKYGKIGSNKNWAYPFWKAELVTKKNSYSHQ